MSIEARIGTLSEKHQALEAALAEERNHAASDQWRISDLKRKKLAIKDEMTMLRNHTLGSGQKAS